MGNVPMPQVLPNGPGIVAIIGQLIPAGVAQHVGMDGDAQGG
jgi:hypothetical protein